MTPSNQHSDEAIGAIIAEARANVASAAFGATPNQAEKILRGEVADDRIRLLVSMADALEELVAGRESKHLTDGETLIDTIARALRPDAFWNETADYPTSTRDDWEAEQAVARIEAAPIATAILAAPSLSLVAARRDFAEKASAHMRANGHGFTRRIDMELLYDALFASGILKPSSDYLVWVSEDGSRHDHPVAGSGHWVHESRSEVEAAALEAFKDRLLAAVGPVVMHANGSGGVFEFSPKGTPTEFWGYENAVAVSSAVIEVLGLLGYEFPSTRGTTYAGGRDKPRTLQDAMDEAARVRSGKDEA